MQVKQTEFEQFYNASVEDIYRYAYFKTSNAETAEDITSEAFLRMLDSEKWSTIENKKAWLVGTTRNIVYETYREKYKPVDVDQGELNSTPESDYTPETEAIEAELVELAKGAIEKLDELTKEVIVLRVWEQLPFAEIAGIVELKESATKLRYYRGIEKLKSLVDADEGTKLRSISIPVILGAVLMAKQNPVYALPAEFASKLSNMLTTQIMDTVKTDSVVKAATNAATNTTTTASSATTNTLLGGFQIGSLSSITTATFATKAFMYSLAAISIVGATAIVASDQVSTAIRNQPAPQVARIDQVFADNNLIEVDPEEVSGEEQEEAVVDTSNWATFEDQNYGIRFKHPADQEVEFIEGNLQAGFYITGLNTSFLTKYSPDQLEYFQSNQNQESEKLSIIYKGEVLELNAYGFGEGYPAGFDAEGNVTCVEGGGFIENYIELDGVLASVRKLFSSSTCNPENKEILTETDPVSIETGRLIIESLEVFEPPTIASLTAGWSTYSGTAFSFKYPPRMSENNDQGLRYYRYLIDDNEETYLEDRSTTGQGPHSGSDSLAVFIDSINAESLLTYKDYIGSEPFLTGGQSNTFKFGSFRDTEYLKMGFWNMQSSSYDYSYAVMLRPGTFLIFVEIYNNIDELETIIASLESDEGYVRGEQGVLDYTIALQDGWNLTIMDDDFRFFKLAKGLTSVVVGKANQLPAVGFGALDSFSRDITLDIGGAEYQLTERTIGNCSNYIDINTPDCIDGEFNDIDRERTDINSILINTQTDLTQEDPNGPVTIRIETVIPEDSTYGEYLSLEYDDYLTNLTEIGYMLGTLRLK